MWFMWAIASLGTLLGNIDYITPILTMFYLVMYGMINFCFSVVLGGHSGIFSAVSLIDVAILCDFCVM